MHNTQSSWHRVHTVYLGGVGIVFGRVNNYSITTKVAKFDFPILLLEWQNFKEKKDVSREKVRDNHFLQLFVD